MQHTGVEVHDRTGIIFEWARVVDMAFKVIRASAAKYDPAPVRL
jgi:hypothetical protein